MVTHDMEKAAKADRIICIEDGRIVDRRKKDYEKVATIILTVILTAYIPVNTLQEINWQSITRMYMRA